LKEVQNIFVSRLKFMGDVILTLPLVQNLRKTYPSARITYLTAAPYHELLTHHPDIDEVIAFDLSKPLKQAENVIQLLSKPFDISIDLFGNPRTAVLTFLTGAKIRIGGDFRGRRRLYTHKVNNSGIKMSSVEFHLNYLRPLGIEPVVTMPRLFITEREEDWAEKYFRSLGYDTNKPIVGIHAGATWPAKMWHAERFAELAKRLKNELGAEIFFTAGPKDLGHIKKMIYDYSLPVKVPEVLSIRKLCAVIKKFSLFISNDCGPMHIAPALNVSTIGIFGPGEPEIWFPYKRKDGHRYIHKTLKCSRCGRDFCDDLKCMNAISVQDVFLEAADLLSDE